MTRSRLTLLVSALVTTACGQLLDASPDGLSFGGVQPPPLGPTCNAGTGQSGGAGGQAGSISVGGRSGSGGTSAGSGGGGGTSAGTGGVAGTSAGTAGTTSGAAGNANAGTKSGGGGKAGGGGNQSAGSAGSAGTEAGGSGGGGGAAGSGTTGATYPILSKTFTDFEATPLTLDNVSEMAPLRLGDDQFQLFAREDATTSTRRVQVAKFEKGTWVTPTWTPLTGSSVSPSLSVVMDAFSVPHVLVTQGTQLTNYFLYKGAWTSSSLVTSTADATIGVAKGEGESGEIEVYIQDGGKLGRVVVSNNDYSGEQLLDASLFEGSVPAVVSDKEGSVHVFVRWNDSTLRHMHMVHGLPGTWEILASKLTSSPAVTSWGPGRLDVFALSGGSLVYTALDKGETVVSPSTITTTFIPDGTPAAVSWGPGLMRVLVRDTAGTVYMASLKP